MDTHFTLTLLFSAMMTMFTAMMWSAMLRPSFACELRADVCMFIIVYNMYTSGHSTWQLYKAGEKFQDARPLVNSCDTTTLHPDPASCFTLSKISFQDSSKLILKYFIHHHVQVTVMELF